MYYYHYVYDQALMTRNCGRLTTGYIGKSHSHVD
jgi:hypothetical protein